MITFAHMNFKHLLPVVCSLSEMKVLDSMGNQIILGPCVLPTPTFLMPVSNSFYPRTGISPFVFSESCMERHMESFTTLSC